MAENIVFWLSFAAPEPPARCCIIEARSPLAAYKKARRLGLRLPGAQTLIFAIPPGSAEAQMPRNRWLTEAELQAADTLELGEVADELHGIERLPDP